VNTYPKQEFKDIAAIPELVSLPNKPIMIIKRIGSTTYRLTVHFSRTSQETFSDKIARIIQRDVESGVAGA